MQSSSIPRSCSNGERELKRQYQQPIKLHSSLWIIICTVTQWTDGEILIINCKAVNYSLSEYCTTSVQKSTGVKHSSYLDVILYFVFVSPS